MPVLRFIGRVKLCRAFRCLFVFWLNPTLEICARKSMCDWQTFESCAVLFASFFIYTFYLLRAYL